MLATVALLACFAVVVMPSLFTVAPNRRAGLPSSAPQAAVSAPVEMSQLAAISAPVEMPQPLAVSVRVETPLPAAVSALVKTSQPIAFAHWLASDLSRPGPEPRPVPRGREGLSEPGPRNAAESDGLIEPPADDIRPGRNVPVADSEGTRENKLLTDDAVNMSFVGIWAADASRPLQPIRKELVI